MRKHENNQRPSELLADELRNRRQLLNITIEELSEKTGIQTKYLRRIERGAWQDIPSGVYTRGFLKSYARAVGLNGDGVVRRYDKEQSSVSQEAPDDYDGGKSLSPTRFWQRLHISPRLLRTLIISIVLALILGYISYQFSVVLAPPKLMIENPSEEEFISTSDSVVLRGQADPGISVFLNDQPLNTDQAGFFEKTIELLPGVNVLEVKAVSHFNKETVQERRIIYNP